MKLEQLLQTVCKTLIYGGFTALLLSQSVFTATPAEAFWFFHKHKRVEEQNTQPVSSTSSYLPTGQSVRYLPSSYMPNRMRGKCRRLVPAYMYSNSQNNNRQTNLEGGVSDKQIDKAVSESPVVAPSVMSINHIVRVGIGIDLEKAKLSILDGAQVIDDTSGRVIANLPGQSQWTINREEDQIVLAPKLEYYQAIEKLALAHENVGAQTEIQTVAYRPSYDSNMTNGTNQDLSISVPETLPSNINNVILPIVFSENATYTIKPVTVNGKSGLLGLNDRIYRGDFLIQNNKEKLNVINVLNLEDYLLAVVPSEMPSLWPEEALKAQAIAARSYAVANLGKHASDGYDVKDNTEDQMYLGVRAETDATNKAVNFTNGMVIKYDGKPICAYFHSAGGGTTEAAENVWRKPIPYLKAVADFDQDSPMYNWTKSFTAEQALKALPAEKSLGKILSISISEKSPSGRAVHLLISGSRNSCVISGEAARKYFSLPSTNFNVTPLENAYIFAGKGFGHGLGLSQWGAKSLADHGYNAAQILCYYYNGVSIGY